MDRQRVRSELEHARTEFRRLLDSATTSELRSASNGTRRTNQELLFHMLFGYLVVRTLLVLVRVFGRLRNPRPTTALTNHAMGARTTR